MKSVFVLALAVAAMVRVRQAIRRAGPKLCEHCQEMTFRCADAD